jgi:hypothetical protein
MARVPVPQQGQPLDLSYIATLANAINQLSEEGAALAQGNNFIVKGRLNETAASYKLYGAQIIAQEVIISTGGSDKGQEQINFSPYNFSSPPIVTATLIGPSNLEANVSLENVTSASATVVVKFPTSENGSATVSIIAVGLPINSP